MTAHKLVLQYYGCIEMYNLPIYMTTFSAYICCYVHVCLSCRNLVGLLSQLSCIQCHGIYMYIDNSIIYYLHASQILSHKIVSHVVYMRAKVLSCVVSVYSIYNIL